MGRAKLRALAFYPATENGRLAARPRRPYYRASMHNDNLAQYSASYDGPLESPCGRPGCPDLGGLCRRAKLQL